VNRGSTNTSTSTIRVAHLFTQKPKGETDDFLN
jgi:hypothetical protein